MYPILLKCYLGRSGDAKNMLLLYEQVLVVIFKGKRQDFALNTIKGLTVTRKKLIIPLVIGGIGTSLSWLALSLGWYHYHTNLFVVFLFFGWMYYGFLGKDALELLEGKHRQVFLIQTNQYILNTFIKITKERAYGAYATQSSICFHLAHKSSWESQEQSAHYKHDSLEKEGFIHTSYLSELRTSYERYFKPTDELILVGIDLNRVEAEVQVEHVEERNADFPHIYGKLNKSAIIILRLVNSKEDLELKTID